MVPGNERSEKHKHHVNKHSLNHKITSLYGAIL